MNTYACPFKFISGARSRARVKSSIEKNFNRIPRLLHRCFPVSQLNSITRKEGKKKGCTIIRVFSTSRPREHKIFLWPRTRFSPAACHDTKDQICHLLTIHGLECNPLGETGLGWTPWWAKKRAGIGNSSRQDAWSRWSQLVCGGRAVSNG